MYHKLKPSDVVYILTSTDSAVSLAAELKVSRQCINQVRLGKVYAKVAPSIPRWRPQTKMCRSCAHWENDACAFDFPEAGLNSRFASECSLFVESKKQD